MLTKFPSIQVGMLYSIKRVDKNNIYNTAS